MVLTGFYQPVKTGLVLTTATLLSIQTSIYKKIKTMSKMMESLLGDEFMTIFESFPGLKFKLKFSHFSLARDSILGDPGCLAPLLLNVYTLQPGQAIFVPAGEIHAYIQGDCIEVGIFIVNGISNQYHTRSCPAGTMSSSVASCTMRTWLTSLPSSRTPTSSPRLSTFSRPLLPWLVQSLTPRVTSASPHPPRSSG